MTYCADSKREHYGVPLGLIQDGIRGKTIWRSVGADSRLPHDQTCYIYETNANGADGDVINVKNIVETANHFQYIDLVIEQADKPL